MINKGEIRTTKASKKGIIQAFMVTITKLLFCESYSQKIEIENKDLFSQLNGSVVLHLILLNAVFHIKCMI